METINYKVTAPKIGSKISVYHPRYGSTNMEVVGKPYENTIPCEYENIEYTVKLGKVYTGGKIEYRWEAEEL